MEATLVNRQSSSLMVGKPASQKRIKASLRSDGSTQAEYGCAVQAY